MSDVLLKTAFQSGVLDSGDGAKLGPTAWNAARLFSGGNDGEICVRAAASATGASWLTPALLKTSLALSKSDVGLSLVENTALSTWGGSGNLTTLGTLTAGATGTGFTVALSTATITGTLADGRLSANVPLLNGVNLFSAIQTITKDALAAVSTDALILQNTTAATAGVPVQQSPRLRLRSNVWNTTTPATNTDDWFIESVPLNGATPSGLLKFGKSLNGAAVTFPLTVSSNGTVTTVGGGDFVTQGGVFVGGAQRIGWTNQGGWASLANGQYLLRTNGTTEGVGFDVLTDGVLKIRTRAHTGDATISALLFQCMTAIVAAGGGAAPTFTTIGGSGPATAAQNGWRKELDSTGAACYVPVWK